MPDPFRPPDASDHAFPWSAPVHELPLEMRVWQLERLVLFMAKFVDAPGPHSPMEHGIGGIIEGTEGEASRCLTTGRCPRR